LKKDANPQVILNNLYKHTNFQVNYGIIFLVIDMGTPKTLGLKDIIAKYIDHQKEVIVRRTKFDLDKDEKRVHILEGYKIAQDNIDEVIKIIKSAESDIEAKENLMNRFKLSEIQADAILELKLRRLTGLERDKIEEELKQLLEEIEELKSILASEEKILKIIKDELLEIKNKYADERRTSIDMTAIDYIEDESLIPVEDIIVTLTNKGYIKRVTTDTYKTQNRGGVGIKGMSTNEEDFAEHLLYMTTHDYILFFSNKGKTYRIKGYEIPEFSRQSKGLPIINILPLEKDEKITSMLKIEVEEKNRYIVLCTQNGIIKRTDIKEFENIRSNGKIAITLKENDCLISAKKTNGKNEILIGSSNGRMIRFDENEIRIMGRTASGVRGIDLGGGICVGCEIAETNQKILVVTEKGYGKQTEIEEYRITHRGSKGVKALNVTEKNGNIVSFKATYGEDDLMIITNSGVIIRLPIEQISTTGRVAQGVRLINLKDEQLVSTIALIPKSDENKVTDEQLVQSEDSNEQINKEKEE
jgi:DNA gyrase subunit A